MAKTDDQTKRIRIPQIVKVGTKVLEVQVVKGLLRREDVLGLYEEDDGLISLEPEQSRAEIERTLVHEILHAMWPKDVVSGKMEEKLIRLLEKPLHDLIASQQLHLTKDEE